MRRRRPRRRPPLRAALQTERRLRNKSRRQRRSGRRCARRQPRRLARPHHACGAAGRAFAAPCWSHSRPIRRTRLHRPRRQWPFGAWPRQSAWRAQCPQAAAACPHCAGRRAPARPSAPSPRCTSGHRQPAQLSGTRRSRAARPAAPIAPPRTASGQPRLPHPPRLARRAGRGRRTAWPPTGRPSYMVLKRYARIFLGTARRRGDGRGGALAARLERVRHAVSFTTGLEP
eukprot:scaffold23257_cov107-Isochrysis_galbana.AAC.2